MTTFRYLTVDEWGGVWARPPVAEKLLDGECFVHHSAGNPWADWDAVRAFRSLNDYAINTKGYSFLDYDVLVHYETARDLVTIGEGRGKWLSAATRDRNEQGEAVCVLGYFHPGHALSQQPTAAHLEGTARAIVWGIEQGWLAPDTKILGHRDNPAHPGATGCPGDYLYAKLPTIRARVAEILAPPPPPPDQSGADMLVIQYVDADTGQEYADQALVIPIDSPSARVKFGIPNSQAPVKVKIKRSEVEAQIPYKLTPLP